MERIAFFDAKPYDKAWFDKANTKYDIRYYESRLCPENAKLAEGCTAVCAFVNDVINAKTIDKLYELGVKVLLMRCAGFNNIALSAAKGKLKILRVPAYSPYAVAEHAMGLLLALNRKIPRAICRTRDFNFSLVGLTGFDLHGKTAGINNSSLETYSISLISAGYGSFAITFIPKPLQISMKTRPILPVPINRSGSLSGRLLFNLEHRTKAEYVTSFGKFDFDIETDLYTLSENENGLGIELKYRLYEGKNLFSENTLTVQIYESSSDSLCSINITRRNNL